MTNHQDTGNNIMAWITGMVGQFLVMETIGSAFIAVLTAGAGGFMGYLGKELGSRLIKYVFKRRSERTNK